MDYITSTGYGLSRHQAVALVHDVELRRRAAARLEQATARTEAARREREPHRRVVTRPRIVMSAAAIVMMGALMGFAAIPRGTDAPPAMPFDQRAPIVGTPSGPAGFVPGGVFIAR